MIHRNLQDDLSKLLKQFPAVAILGPRQVGKTTLAKSLAAQLKKEVVYIDLENDKHRFQLEDADAFFSDNEKRVVIIDEIQRMPQLFAALRSAIDEYRKPSRFIITGSASPSLVKGVSESLAGRIAYTELAPVGVTEKPTNIKMQQHWFRGGFPKALLAKNGDAFSDWMDFFIRSYIERDLPELFDTNFTRSTMRNFWRMLAHHNGSVWNANSFGRALGISGPTVSRYLDFLEGAFIVHKLPAYFYNAKKRIIKAPKVYIRDSGMLHRLDGVANFSSLRANQLIGSSWEGYVIEQIYQAKGRNMDLYYYRTQNGAEADVIITRSSKPVACVEIKFSNSPSLSRGFYETIADLKTKKNFVIVPEVQTHRKEQITLCGLQKFLSEFLPEL